MDPALEILQRVGRTVTREKRCQRNMFFANRADGYQEGRRGPVIVDDGEI